MVGGGIVSGVIRFLCHMPLGTYSVKSLQHWKLVKKHADILLGPPLSHKILVGEQFAGPLGTFAFAWNFVMWIPTIFAPDPLLFYIGLVDALIVVALIVATSIETSYVGKTKHQCAQVPPNGTADQRLIFFERARAINMTDSHYAETLCGDFMASFYVGIAMIIMYGISAFSNISIGAASLRDTSFYYRWNQTTTDSGCLTSLVTIPFTFLGDVIAAIFWSLFCCLPQRIQGSIHFWIRYASKWGYHTKAAAKVKLRLIPRPILPGLSKKKQTHTALANALRNDIVLQIAPKVHYIDLVNLSRVSKRVRAIMFPVGEAQDQERRLRWYSCYGNSKSECWTCGIQICNECTTIRNCRLTTVIFHMQHCGARCSKCFYSAAKESDVFHRSCSCYDARRPGYQTYSSFGYGGSNLYSYRSLCRDCSKMNDADLLAVREKRDRKTYKILTLQPLACATCTEALPRTGPLWWVCSKCSAECRSHDHPDWGRKLEV